jgi:hypothetical protein
MTMKAEEIYKLIEQTRKELKTDFEKLDEKSERIYVKVESFEPVRKLVFGMVGVVLFAVIGAMVAIVIRTPA